MLKNASLHCSKEILKSLYFGCFQSIIMYGVEYWFRSSEAETVRVFKLQKWAIRILVNIRKRDSCRHHFKNQKILTLPSLYIFKVLCFAFKNKSLFTTCGDNHNYETRNRDRLLPEKHSTALYQKSLHYNACKFFNALPQVIKDVKNVHTYKRNVKQLLFEKNCYCLSDYFL